MMGGCSRAAASAARLRVATSPASTRSGAGPLWVKPATPNFLERAWRARLPPILPRPMIPKDAGIEDMSENAIGVVRFLSLAVLGPGHDRQALCHDLLPPHGQLQPLDGRRRGADPPAHPRRPYRASK